MNNLITNLQKKRKEKEKMNYNKKETRDVEDELSRIASVKKAMAISQFPHAICPICGCTFFTQMSNVCVVNKLLTGGVADELRWHSTVTRCCNCNSVNTAEYIPYEEWIKHQSDNIAAIKRVNDSLIEARNKKREAEVHSEEEKEKEEMK